MFIAFGAAFEVPIVVIVLARMGMVSIEKLKEFRGYFVVPAFIVAAVITPPDVVSQLALAIPMCLLYEVGIWAAQIFIKHTQGAGHRSRRQARGLKPVQRAGAPRRRALADRDRQFQRLVAALHRNIRPCLRLQRRHGLQQRGGAGDRLVVDPGDDVARAHARRAGGAVLQHAGDQHAAASPAG